MSASTSCPHPESPTLGVHIEVTDNEDTNTITHASQHSGSEHIPTPALEGPPEDPDPLGDDPDDEPNVFRDTPTPDPSDDKSVDPGAVFANLAKAIDSLAKASCCTPSESTQHTKVQELDQFDGTDPHKLWVFLVQCELKFQDRPKAFAKDCTKVIFA